LCALSPLTPRDISESFNICLKLLKKCDFLEIMSFVLHPPRDLPGSREAADALEQFIELWVKSGLKPEQILLENQPGDNLSFLLATADRLGSGLCFDFAHCHMGRPAAEADICDYAAQSELWHLNAPGPALDGHAPLTALSISQKKALSGLLSKSGQRTYTHSSHVLMLELFEWSKIEQSMPVLEECISASVLY
ncbi:MAG: hypothetical protein IJD04_01270, partial [Desulfovibrionaceae bacterium]|nr:hypothetical protein [Desulfovibrionaceae bacterium]